jgi:hypothetical protein
MLGAAMLAITAASVQATGFANYFAVVSPTGGVTQGVGIVSATRKTVGRYEIKFARPLVFCAYFATIRGVQPGMITAAKKNGVTDIAIVRTFSKTGVSADMPFNLLVQCNS